MNNTVFVVVAYGGDQVEPTFRVLKVFLYKFTAENFSNECIRSARKLGRNDLGHSFDSEARFTDDYGVLEVDFDSEI
jgi:hypothetical protein